MAKTAVMRAGIVAAVCFVIVFYSVRSESAWRGSAMRMADRSGGTNDAEKAIRALLEEQVAAWNRGDVEAFMAGYWKSEQTSFSGVNGVTRGWDGLLNRYKKNYPDRKAMGKLSFGRIEVTPLCGDAAMILGEWQLERENPVAGVFTLVARRFPEGWRIIHDHTDAVAPQNQ